MNRSIILYFFIVIFVLLTSCSSTKEPEPIKIPKIEHPEKLSIKWQKNYLDRNPAYQFVPILDDNVIYTSDKSGTIFKLDSSDGTLIKEYETNLSLSSGTATSASLIFVTTNTGYLVAIDKTSGKFEWRAHLPTISVETPQVSDNIVLVRTNDAQLLAYDVNNGNLLWSYQKPIPTLTLRANNTFQVIGKDVVVLGQPGGKLVLLNLLNGNTIWENVIAAPEGATDLDKLTDIATRPVLDGKEICSASYNGKIECLDAVSSNVIWSKKFSSSSGIIMDSQVLYAIAQDGVIYAFDRQSGITVWSNDILRYRVLSSPIFLGNNILTVDKIGNIYLLNKNSGRLVANMRTNLDEGVSYPVTDSSGRVFLQSANGDIVAISI